MRELWPQENSLLTGELACSQGRGESEGPWEGGTGNRVRSFEGGLVEGSIKVAMPLRAGVGRKHQDPFQRRVLGSAGFW